VRQRTAEWLKGEPFSRLIRRRKSKQAGSSRNIRQARDKGADEVYVGIETLETQRDKLALVRKTSREHHASQQMINLVHLLASRCAAQRGETGLHDRSPL
jgi:hypothetical protein